LNWYYSLSEARAVDNPPIWPYLRVKLYLRKMQASILWTGLENHSLENCALSITAAGAEVNSTIIGTNENKIFKIDYSIRTNSNWETTFVQLSCRHAAQATFFRLARIGDAQWTVNNEPAAQLDGCVDVDISQTPFTNTLPIRRLQLKKHESRQIKVAYFDLLANELKAAAQQYTSVSDNCYKFENVPNDFEALIEIDDFALVNYYPGLFKMTVREIIDN
jgi:uncharacterized protein